MEKVSINFKIDKELKEQLQEVLELLGTDMSTLFIMTAKQTVRDQALPFKPKIKGKNRDLDKII